ncbi:MAG: DUF177 domain-containing protein [Cryomorphaceae bacterium]|jgi:uncharacterized protein|nr:DUF177 domain-containing protein [Cryomorphaceae bacterium]
MLKSSPHILQFSGLKLGNHHFEFVLEASFFDSCESFGINKGVGLAKAQLEKKETMMLLTLTLEAQLEVLCDRCNENMSLDVNGAMELIYKFGTEESLDESLVILPPDSYQMDMFQPMYELLIVSLPSRFIHENDGCDPEVMKFLNSSDTPQDNKNEVDPRWEALNKLN